MVRMVEPHGKHHHHRQSRGHPPSQSQWMCQDAAHVVGEALEHHDCLPHGHRKQVLRCGRRHRATLLADRGAHPFADCSYLKYTTICGFWQP